MNRCASFTKHWLKEGSSALGEDGCGKLLQTASDRWELCDYRNIDVIVILRLVDLKHLNCAGKDISKAVLHFVDHLCFSCRVFVMLSRLFLLPCGHLKGKD